jgi:hypothetical protein
LIKVPKAPGDDERDEEASAFQSKRSYNLRDFLHA